MTYQINDVIEIVLAAWVVCFLVALWWDSSGPGTGDGRPILRADEETKQMLNLRLLEKQERKLAA